MVLSTVFGWIVNELDRVCVSHIPFVPPPVCVDGKLTDGKLALCMAEVFCYTNWRENFSENFRCLGVYRLDGNGHGIFFERGFSLEKTDLGLSGG